MPGMRRKITFIKLKIFRSERRRRMRRARVLFTVFVLKTNKTKNTTQKNKTTNNKSKTPPKTGEPRRQRRASSSCLLVRHRLWYSYYSQYVLDNTLRKHANTNTVNKTRALLILLLLSLRKIFNLMKVIFRRMPGIGINYLNILQTVPLQKFLGRD
jgi:hypothetical protein